MRQALQIPDRPADPGKISRVHSDGTFDIDYDDGEKERNVMEEYIKSMENSRSGGRGRLREGAKVEARYRGRSKFYPGRIARDRGAAASLLGGE